MIQDMMKSGKSLMEAEKVLIMLHGRGGSAMDILDLASALKVADYALLAPEAPGSSWYPQSFLADRAENEPALSKSLKVLADLVAELKAEGFAASQLYFLGFSQGACLALEFAASQATRYGGVAAFTGGVIGDRVDHRNYHGDFDGTPIFIGSSDPDAHVPVSRVKESTVLLEGMGASVTEIIYQNMGHTISHAEITQVNKLIFNG
jgi:phospholipase/carboxylesterase